MDKKSVPKIIILNYYCWGTEVEHGVHKRFHVFVFLPNEESTFKSDSKQRAAFPARISLRFPFQYFGIQNAASIGQCTNQRLHRRAQ
jgi:hypothetical protein